ncbi:MAG: uracil-DNA glycosylase [Bacteriovoracaceae bacterium]|nr:uracil-DNA glycosylase [Bacteriovoracaceae bacterium]
MYKLIHLENNWQEKLSPELQKDYIKNLESFLKEEYSQGKTIYPESSEIFQAFDKTDFNDVKVVIIGQDPYHGEGQAHGMCFSVKPGVKIPPSLRNIYKELEDDLGIPQSNHGYLQHWAEQGVLLLNTVLTVEKAKANSHKKKGWEVFTDRIIEILNEEKKDLVFLLWGSPAQKKAANVDSNKHFVLKSVHPSPLSAYRGFLGSKHFSKTNDFLKSKGIKEIDWKLPEIN